MKSKPIKIILISLVVFLIIPMLALAEEPSPEPSMPGRVEGAGTYFEIQDSEYLNVFLQSTEEITILLESIPKTISLHIEASTSTDSTTLTIGLESNTTYYKFQDSYKNKVVFVSDENGSYSWTQDLTQSHHAWFQPEDNGTVFLPEECINYGSWDENTKTCILTKDLTQSVEITTNNVVLNCNNHSIKGPGFSGYGIYLSNRTGVTVQGCFINNFSSNIYLWNSNNNYLTSNAIEGRWEGISLSLSSDNVLIHNDVSNHLSFGLYLYSGSNNKVYHNNFINNGLLNAPPCLRCGVQAYLSAGNLFDNGYPDGGNYWSDYISRVQEEDLYSGSNQDQPGPDGIGDVPYRSYGNGQDRYSFMEESGWAVPSVPTYNVAAILAEPSDKNFESEHNKAYFEAITEQVKDYYCENSFGKWNANTKTCENGVFNLNFDIYDNEGLNYKLFQTQEYYGKNFPQAQEISLGFDSNSREIKLRDEDRTEQFIWDAINKADEDINYNNYQSVIIIYAGSSYQQTEQKDYLTTQWWTPDFPPAPINSPDEFINNWISVAENETKYAWAHELGHALGNILTGSALCDLYPEVLGFCYYGGSVVDYFDVMGTRTLLWGYIKDTVSYFSSFSRIKLGWFGEKIVGYGSHMIESLETTKFGDEVVRYNLPNGSYYLLEARTNDSQYSKWDTDLPNDPLVIYKVSPKEITRDNRTTTVDFVNVAGAVGAIVPKDPRIPPIPNPLDLPFKDLENNVLIGINNRIVEPDSFKTNAQISEYSPLNYIGAVLRPKLSLLEKIWQFASDPFKTELSEEKEKEIITTPFGPGRKYLHIFGYKIEQVYECAGECIGFYSMMQGILWYSSVFLILLLLLLRFCLRKIILKIKSNRVINILQKARRIILWIIILLAVIFALSFSVSFSVDVNAATLDNVSVPYGVAYKSVVADIDLHAYDEQGRHTGINYGTGEYENQIPGAEASGDLVYDDEWIFVPEGVNVRFVVSSKDVQEMLEAHPELQELIDGIETYEAQAIYYDPKSQRYESNIVTEQIGPGQELEHRISDTYEIVIGPGTIIARVDFDPDTLNLKSKGKYVTTYIELPIGYDIGDINIVSIRFNDQIQAETKLAKVGDYDNNSIPDLMIKFDRSAVQNILRVGNKVEITITGELIDGKLFQGNDTIKVFLKEKWGDILGAGLLVFFAGIGLLTRRQRNFFQSNAKGKIILILILLIALGAIIGFLIYYLPVGKEEMPAEKEGILVEKEGVLVEKEGVSLEKKVSGKDFSFRYSDNIWQFKEESPLGFYIDGQLIHRELKYCEVWMGSDGWGGPCEGLTEEDCKTISDTGDKTLQLGEGAYIRYRMLDIERKGEQTLIFGRYGIYLEGKEWPLYTFELFTSLVDRQQCINDFEPILKTFEFK